MLSKTGYGYSKGISGTGHLIYHIICPVPDIPFCKHREKYHLPQFFLNLSLSSYIRLQPSDISHQTSYIRHHTSYYSIGFIIDSMKEISEYIRHNKIFTHYYL